MKGLKNIAYLSIAAGMIVYAVPRLDMGQGMTPPTIFGIVWLAMALLIVASHLHQLMGVEEETKQELERIKKYRRWKIEKYLTNKGKVLLGKK